MSANEVKGISNNRFYKKYLSKEAAERIDKELKEEELVNNLSGFRCLLNLTQKEMAQKLGKSQAYISKLENSKDLELTIEEIASYASVAGYSVNISFTKRGTTIVDSIKYHAHQIKEGLQKLLDLSKEDKSIKKGIEAFMDEAFFNVSKIVLDKMMKLNNYKSITELIRKKKFEVHDEPVRIHQYDNIDQYDKELINA